MNQLTQEQEEFCLEFGIPIGGGDDADQNRRIRLAHQTYNTRVQFLLRQESRASTPEERSVRSAELTNYLGKGLEDLLKQAGVEFPLKGSDAAAASSASKSVSTMNNIKPKNEC
jgi:hypothetical protein